MALIETIDNSLFRSRFRDYDRAGDGKDFSWRGVDALFNYLDCLSDDTGEDIELDVIGLCCDYSELEIGDIWNDYSHLFEDLSRDDYVDDDALNGAALGVLSEHTTVIEVEHYQADSTYIVQVF